MQIAHKKGDLSLKPLVDRVMQVGQVSRREHLQLTSMLLSAHRLNPEDRIQINRILDYLQAGRLKIVDRS